MNRLTALLLATAAMGQTVERGHDTVVLQADLTGDGLVDAAKLDLFDTAIELALWDRPVIGPEGLPTAPAASFEPFVPLEIYALEDFTLGVTEGGSLTVEAFMGGDEEAATRLTIAHRDGFVVAGYTVDWYAMDGTGDFALIFSCDVNFLTGQAIVDGEPRQTAPARIPVQDWVPGQEPEVCG